MVTFSFFLEDLGSMNLCPPLDGHHLQLCALHFVPVMWEREKNECLLKIEFMTRDQPPSTRLIGCPGERATYLWFSFQLPTFLDVLSMCLITEAKKWALAVFIATGGFH